MFINFYDVIIFHRKWTIIVYESILQDILGCCNCVRTKVINRVHEYYICVCNERRNLREGEESSNDEGATME